MYRILALSLSIFIACHKDKGPPSWGELCTWYPDNCAEGLYCYNKNDELNATAQTGVCLDQCDEDGDCTGEGAWRCVGFEVDGKLVDGQCRPLCQAGNADCPQMLDLEFVCFGEPRLDPRDCLLVAN